MIYIALSITIDTPFYYTRMNASVFLSLSLSLVVINPFSSSLHHQWLPYKGEVRLKTAVYGRAFLTWDLYDRAQRYLESRLAAVKRDCFTKTLCQMASIENQQLSYAKTSD
jgi:hypothetical protein